MDSNVLNIEEIRARAGSGGALRWVAHGMFVFVVVSVLLNGSGLKRSVSRMEYGLCRDVCMGVVGPVAEFSSLLRADQLRAWVENVPISKGK